MSRVVISRQAETDLARIYRYLAAHNPDAAEHFRVETEKAVALIATNPGMGTRPGWKTRHSQLRFWVISRFNNYLIYYEAARDEILIARVLDGRRDIQRILARTTRTPRSTG